MKIEYALAENNEIPSSGKFLKVEIVDAISMGNAFMGHRKQVRIRVALYVDGEKTETNVFSRDSMGGFGASFKGSCSVLGRCCETLGKDVAKWLKQKA